MSKTFKSAVDWWYYLVVASIPLFFLIPTTFTAIQLDGELSAFIALFAVGLPVWLLFSTEYLVDNEILLVKAGPFRWRVPIRSIRKIEPSRSARSSPALSLNRLKIEYGSGQSLLVSPKEPQAFLNSLGLS